jgi:hypothetical protein
MSEPTRPDDADLFRALSQHLESLRAAGVEWLPARVMHTAMPPAEPAPTAQPALAAAPPAPVAAEETWLFPETDRRPLQR